MNIIKKNSPAVKKLSLKKKTIKILRNAELDKIKGGNENLYSIIDGTCTQSGSPLCKTK